MKKSKGGVLKFCNGANCELEKGGCRHARVITYRAIKETNKQLKDVIDDGEGSHARREARVPDV